MSEVVIEMPKEAIEILSRDPVMKGLIDRFGAQTIRKRGQPFAELVRSIISQQLSTKAAAKIWERVKNLLSDVNPKNILEARENDLRRAGLSASKVKYVKALAEAAFSGEIDFAIIDTLDDSEIIEKLTKIKGIGEWTAQMFLMFCLGREDVFPVGDLVIQKAMMRIYGYAVTRPGIGHIVRLDPASRFLRFEALDIAENWRPYRTYASIYLWRSMG
ncbi:MAG: DNA-3-methyladenine glycosylase [Firmicutes bacterium]|nr:DNA-3-methyladenine glycosylase [Bacillota bacterium]